MRYRSTLVRILAIAALWLAFSSPSVASDDAFKVIVHRDVPGTAVERAFLRRVFLRTAIEWDNGVAVRPVDLATGSPVRDRFTAEVLGKTPSAMRSYWMQRIFSGTAVPPPEVKSAAQVIAYVQANPGAVGYIPATADPGQTKVVSIR